ncbi:MAG: ABC transporter permease [Gemmatimonadota bacterium]
MLEDLRYAIRQLRRSPGFAAIAILTLALGIGANTAIFTVIDATLLRPLAYKDPDQLVTVEHFYPSLNNMLAPVSVAGFLAYQKKTDSFESASVEQGWGPSLTGHGEPERMRGARVTGDFFTVYGVPAEIGRVLRSEEATAGKDKAVVLSHGLWQRSFGGDRSIIGQRLLLDGESYEVVGVMPPDFKDFFNARAEMWSPLVFTPAQMDPNRWTNEFLSFTGRIRHGKSLEQVTADMAAYGLELRHDNPDRFSPTWGLKVTSLNEKATGNIRSALIMLLVAVGFVLLIACANVANLQLARAASRSREIAVRVALGASPGALIRLLLTESVLLSLAGGGLGLLLAIWGVPALIALNSRNLPAAADLHVNGPILLYTLVLSVITGLLFGMAPALRLGRTSLQESLKDGGKGAAGDRGGMALRRGLVIGTLAMALTLLAGAGLLVRSFGRLVGVDPGFNTGKLLTFTLALPASKYPGDTARIAFWERFQREASRLPGVSAVGVTSVMPFGGSWGTSSFNVEGYQVPANTPGPWGDVRNVTPGFLAALKAPLRLGRQFDEHDIASSPAVVIVDEEMVARYWPSQDPLGKRITFNGLSDSSIQWLTVVGVVGHTMHEGLDGKRRVQVYFPMSQAPVGFGNVAIRSTGDPMALLPTVKASLHGIDPDMPIANVSTMDQLIDATTGQRRFAMYLLSGFSILAAVLASIGLYGVMSYLVTQRARELGVRLALGAATSDVLRLVVGQGMRLAFIGVGIGLVCALLVTRFIRSLLFDIAATDPLTFVLIPLLLLAVAFLAVYLPALKATRVDPVVVLRAE